jgi:predicted ATPase/DNA-binding winged helix-turn-helix (wHTH) protein
VGDVSTHRAAEYTFGPFRFVPGQHLLLRNGVAVPLNARACEILLALVERSGSYLTAEELIARAWPRGTADESNLKFYIATLRKALSGEAYISSVAGNGYGFAANKILAVEAAPLIPEVLATSTNRLPAPLARMVGRDEAVTAIVARLTQHRFVTIVGPGGIGKTTIAVAVGNKIANSFPDGASFVDLSPVTDSSLVVTAVATSLGVPVRVGGVSHGLIASLKDRGLLLILDNCEHVIEAAAALAEELFRVAPGLCIIATSREPLRAEGERVYRLNALEAPADLDQITAVQALEFPAVQLFVDRASAAADTFALSDSNASAVADICRRLDGVALAIEIAAGRIGAFGIARLSGLLNDRFRLAMRGRRTAFTRHQTLQMALDWSHELLSETERVGLRRLAIFSGAFTEEAATVVLECGASPIEDAQLTLDELVSKSLVNVNLENEFARYKLLETTRAYAAIKLDASPDRSSVARRHAEYYRDVMMEARRRWSEQPAAEWLEAHRHLIDNVRAALEWALSSSGDPLVAVTLTAAAIPLWFQMSLISECCDRVQIALATPLDQPDSESDLQLHAALAWSLMQTRGSVPETRTAWGATLELAETLGNIDFQLRALWGLWSGLLNGSQLREALSTAEHFHSLAEKSLDPSDVFVGDRMVGYILHLLGDQERARFHIERMLAGYIPPVSGEKLVRFVFDQRVTARCFLARILWIQGFPDQALAAVDAALSESAASGDPLTVCQALVQAACPIAILAGDLARLTHYVSRLLHEAERNGFGFWRVWGGCFDAMRLIKGGDLDLGIVRLAKGLEQLREIQYGVYYVVFLCEYADALSRCGQVNSGLVAIDEALNRARRNEESWYLAELLRVKAELLMQRGGRASVAEAERSLHEALALARHQGALSWRLRAAMSFTRLRSNTRDREAAAQLLSSTYGEFSEGIRSADLLAARQRLEELPPVQ